MAKVTWDKEVRWTALGHVWDGIMVGIKHTQESKDQSFVVRALFGHTTSLGVSQVQWSQRLGCYGVF